MTLEELKFPIGHFTMPTVVSKTLLNNWSTTIETFPEKIKSAVLNLSNKQLDTPYRPNGWTIRQVVHHCADSHMNSLIRFKLTLTEDRPTIKPYLESSWAELVDSKNYPIESSLQIIDGVHKRWCLLLKNLTENELKRTFIHPENKTEISISENIGIYAWHCNHHLSHITTAIRLNGW